MELGSGGVRAEEIGGAERWLPEGAGGAAPLLDVDIIAVGLVQASRQLQARSLKRQSQGQFLSMRVAEERVTIFILFIRNAFNWTRQFELAHGFLLGLNVVGLKQFNRSWFQILIDTIVPNKTWECGGFWELIVMDDYDLTA